MPGTAKRKYEASSSVASLNSGVHEQKPADSAIQPLGGISKSVFSSSIFASSQLDVTTLQNNDKCSLGMTS